MPRIRTKPAEAKAPPLIGWRERVRLPEIGTHLGAATVYGRMCEYVDWFADLFAGGPKFQNNQLLASAEPGLGLTVNDDYAAKCRV